jgi:hypothetical protein
MPLSAPAARELIHNRDVLCRGFHRDDGLWDIEGHLVDSKTYDFPNRYRGEMKAGQPVHGMWVRLTLDDDLVIHAVEAVTDDGPYPVCPVITPRFRELEGLRIGPGFTRAVRQRLGGTSGCTHLVELLRPVATTAFQTIYPRRHRRASGDAEHRPPFLDTCHALASDGPVVRDHWPEWYTGEQ